MSMIDANVSMLEKMSEEERVQADNSTQSLFTSRKQGNPFIPVTEEQVLSDLAVSRKEIAEGKGLDMKEALNELGRKHGFI